MEWRSVSVAFSVSAGRLTNYWNRTYIHGGLSFPVGIRSFVIVWFRSLGVEDSKGKLRGLVNATCSDFNNINLGRQQREPSKVDDLVPLPNALSIVVHPSWPQ